MLVAIVLQKLNSFKFEFIVKRINQEIHLFRRTSRSCWDLHRHERPASKEVGCLERLLLSQNKLTKKVPVT